MCDAPNRALELLLTCRRPFCPDTLSTNRGTCLTCDLDAHAAAAHLELLHVHCHGQGDTLDLGRHANMSGTIKRAGPPASVRAIVKSL